MSSGIVRQALIVFFLGASPAYAQFNIGTGGAMDLYRQNCAGCHGPNLEGGSAGSLIDDQWKGGGTDEAIATTIRNGLPGTAMPAWSQLSGEQVRSLVILMREQRESARLKALEKANTVEPGKVFESQKHAFRLEPVIEMPGILWAADLLPDGSLLTTLINGTLFHVVDGKATAITGTPAVYAEGQGGLLDVKVYTPRSGGSWVYLTFAEKREGGAMTAVVRGRIRDGRWVEQQDIFRVPREQLIDTNWHYGSRLAIAGDYLFFGIGDRGRQEWAQDPARPNGKIHRVYLDGSIPKDNPFRRQRGLATVWTLGHRNPQGLDAHPATGEIWESEHGPRGGDEVNHIRRGLNYGWPRATHGMNYDGTAIAAEPIQPGMEEPARFWTPSISPGGIAFYVGERFPQWKGNLFVGGQGARELHRLTLEGNQVVADETVMSGQGRVRDVLSGADGYLYVVLNNPEPAASGIYRLVPVAADPTKLQMRPALTMALAQKMALACVKHQQDSNGPPVDVAIYDDGAKLIYFVGMDGTSSGTGPTAMAKGESSARFRYPTAEIAGWVKGNPGVGFVPGLLGARGGLPIFTGSGKPLGGIGVSGAPSEVDERCAQAGIDAVRPELRAQ